MPIPQIITERIETFRRNLDSYLRQEYKEAQVRQEFIDPFFAALGWDVRNEQGYAEAYKDIVHEDTLRISGSGTSAPVTAKSISSDDETPEPGSAPPATAPVVYNPQAESDAAHHYFFKEDPPNTSRNK